MSSNQVKYFSLGKFARLCGVHKKTLFHYDDIGLFKPGGMYVVGYLKGYYDKTYVLYEKRKRRLYP